MNFKKSIIEKITFNNHSYFIKRDDLSGAILNGNKGRKLFFLKDLEISKIISYGGVQSNMLPPLSLFATLKDVEFIYYCKPIPKFLKDNPIGNYKIALKNTKFIEVAYENWHKKVENLKCEDKEILIKQGGLQKEAEIGLKLLADEIEEWARENNMKDLNIFLPSGTGSTAIFLQRNLDFKVYTTPCVGSKEYLIKQFLEIESNRENHPTILDLDVKYHFGKPYDRYYQIYKDLKTQTNIEFDLLYDPKGWLVLEQFRKQIGENILYIHQGGILGNESMLERYRQTIRKE